MMHKTREACKQKRDFLCLNLMDEADDLVDLFSRRQLAERDELIPLPDLVWPEMGDGWFDCDVGPLLLGRRYDFQEC